MDVEESERWVESDDSSKVANGLVSLVLTYQRRGQDEKSQPHLRRLQRLAKSGNERAQEYLPTALVMSGKAEAAIPLLEEAASEGSSGAAYFLSSIYSGEIGDETDLENAEQALHWRRKAASLGHDEARRDLAHYRRQQ